METTAIDPRVGMLIRPVPYWNWPVNKPIRPDTFFGASAGMTDWWQGVLLQTSPGEAIYAPMRGVVETHGKELWIVQANAGWTWIHVFRNVASEFCGEVAKGDRIGTTTGLLYWKASASIPATSGGQKELWSEMTAASKLRPGDKHLARMWAYGLVTGDITGVKDWLTSWRQNGGVSDSAKLTMIGASIGEAIQGTAPVQTAKALADTAVSTTQALAQVAEETKGMGGKAVLVSAGLAALVGAALLWRLK